jgi:hypothetical protein
MERRTTLSFCVATKNKRREDAVDMANVVRTSPRRNGAEALSCHAVSLVG